MNIDVNKLEQLLNITNSSNATEEEKKAAALEAATTVFQGEIVAKFKKHAFMVKMLLGIDPVKLEQLVSKANSASASEEDRKNAALQACELVSKSGAVAKIKTMGPALAAFAS
jgi:hypothetical protein